MSADMLEAATQDALPEDDNPYSPVWPDDDCDEVEAQAFVADIAENLSRRGYCLVNIRISEDAREQALDEAYAMEEWQLPPEEFISAYLGLDNKTKVALLPPDSVDSEPNPGKSMLQKYDRKLSMLSCRLDMQANAALGLELAGRLDGTVRVPFRNRAEKARMSAKSRLRDDVDDAEQVLGHLNFLERRLICMLSVLACDDGIITLAPRGGSDATGLRERTFPVPCSGGAACCMIFRHDLFEYSYKPQGPSVALQTWLLGPGFQPQPDTIVLPRCLHGDQVWVHSMGVRLPRQLPSGTTNVTWPGALFFAGTDGSVRVPATRFDIDLYHVDDRKGALDVGKSYTKHGSFCCDGEILSFDPSFFNMDEAEASFASPAHKVIMEVGYEILHQMNLAKAEIPAVKKMGIFIGDSGVDWDDIMHGQLHESPADVYHGWTCHIGACRLATFLGVTGPVSVVDTACSSGLVAFHNAHNGLQKAADKTSNRRATADMEFSMPMAINCLVSPKRFLQYCGATMLSSKGRCFTFDLHCDGFLRGEACAALLLRRGSEDFDVHAALTCSAGSALNQDGRSASLTAPHGPSQSMLIRQSLQEAGISPAEVTTFECHGTGTALGDPIEVNALTAVVMENREDPGVTGSSKASCGHSEAGAGMVGLCKCILMAVSAVDYPSNHLRSLNPNIDISYLPCYVATEPTDVGGTVCIAGVSSFGSGGTNARSDHWGRAMMGPRAVDPQQIWTEQDSQLRDVYFWDRVCQHGKPGPQPFDRIYIRGTWDCWKDMVPLTRTSDGNFQITIAMSKLSFEYFQLCLNGDEKQAFFPVDSSGSQTSAIKGPSSRSKAKSWCIGDEQDAEKVKLFRIFFQWHFNWDDGERLYMFWHRVDRQESSEEDDQAADIDCRRWQSQHRYFLALKPHCRPNQEMRKVSRNTWEVRVEVSRQGDECFQIWRDNDALQAIQPVKDLAKSSRVPIAGPSGRSLSNYWVLEGQPGDVAKITLSILPEVTTVTWANRYMQKTWKTRDEDSGHWYAIVTASSGWEARKMWHEPESPGLYTSSVVLSASGEEEFYICREGNVGESFQPEEHLADQGVRMVGPVPFNHAWLICGTPGDVYVVYYDESEVDPRKVVGWKRADSFQHQLVSTDN
mmetsp:Transcript_47812/g.113607  ORF Transcript_47812/g.113607 Transcript_47812/m.113607 type:complete len:1135 (-) Transcript_47812:144-3548(-)